jgi:hypothetical protein
LANVGQVAHNSGRTHALALAFVFQFVNEPIGNDAI